MKNHTRVLWCAVLCIVMLLASVGVIATGFGNTPFMAFDKIVGSTLLLCAIAFAAMAGYFGALGTPLVGLDKFERCDATVEHHNGNIAVLKIKQGVVLVQDERLREHQEQLRSKKISLPWRGSPNRMRTSLSPASALAA